MTLFDSGRTLAERFRTHAGTRTHLYGHAMRGLADDWEAGGPVRSVCSGYEDAPVGSSVQLRLLAGVFRLVLTGRAPELVPFYPVLGGTRPAAEAWPVMRAVIDAHVDELHADLEVAPQTNEVGRCAALLAGVLDLVRASGCDRVLLLELGASAGLNLLLDEYGYSGDGWTWGSATSPVQLSNAITGQVTARPFSVVGRRGCDLHPVDATSDAGRLLLTSFVWPFDLVRHQRLQAALEVASAHPVVVDQAAAGDWLADQLARGSVPEHGGEQVLTVVWHSITQLYWPQEEIDQVRDILEQHGRRSQVAEVAMEFDVHAAEDAKPLVSTELWDPGAAQSHRRRILGTAHDHGPPVRLDGPV
jgi:hypothetical protein